MQRVCSSGEDSVQRLIWPILPKFLTLKFLKVAAFRLRNERPHSAAWPSFSPVPLSPLPVFFRPDESDAYSDGRNGCASLVGEDNRGLHFSHRKTESPFLRY